MNTTLIVILTIMAIVVLITLYISAWCGCQAGIEYAMKYSISRTVDEMRKGFEQMGYGEIFDKVVENTLNIEKLQQYKED